MTDKKQGQDKRHLAALTSPSGMLALAGMGLMAGTSPAMAQESDGSTRLGGVTVTDTAIEDSFNRSEMQSDRSTAPLVNTPQTVSVIPHEVIRDRGARTLTEVLRNTPGISFNAGENGFGTSTDNFSLRGVDASGSIFIDNARDSGSYTRDMFNVESVEVVKGAAADNGRGSGAGFININTKRPTLDFFVNGDVSYGFDQYDSESRKRLSFDANQPLGGTAAVRVNAVVEESGVPGRNLAKNSLWGLASSFAVGLNTPFRAVVSFEHVERDDRPDWGVPGATIEGLFTHDPATAGAPRDGFYGLLFDFDDARSDAIFARLEYDLSSDVTLSNQTRWTRVDRRARFTMPTGFAAATESVPTSTQFYDRLNKSLSNITNLSAKFDTGGLSHTVAAGVELSWEKSRANRMGAADPLPGAANLFDPDPTRAGASAFNVADTADVDVDTIAFYLYDTIEIGDHFQITGGIRGENYEATIADSGGGVADNFTTSPFVWNGKVGLVYKPNKDGSVYVSFGTAALPPGSFLSNPDISRTGDNAFPGFVADAVPVRSHNYEAGVKWDFFDGALSATAALFRTERRNVPIVGRPEGVTTGPTSLQGYHKQETRGVEIGLAGQITPAWNVFGGLLVMDSERKISPELAAIQRAANTGDFPGDFAAWAIDGDELAFTPNVSATLWTTYRMPFGLTVGAGLQHVGSSYLGRPDDALRIIPNGRFGELPGYTLVNALLSYDLGESVDVRLNVDNILNKKYAMSTNWAGSRATLGAPRTWMLSVGFSY